MARRDVIKDRQAARVRNSGTDTDSEIRYIYGFKSDKPHAAKRSKPRPNASSKPAKKPGIRRRSAEVRDDPAGY